MSGEVLAKEPWSVWRLAIVTSPGSQSSGTASGSRSLPPASTRALMSTRPMLVGAGHDPEAVGGGGGVQLDLEVEAVDAGVPVGRVPVGDAVLVPGDRAADAGLLDEDRVVVGDEVGTVDGGGDAQQRRVAVEAQAGGHGLAHAEHQVDDVVGGAGVGHGSAILLGWRPSRASVPPRGSDSGLMNR